MDNTFLRSIAIPFGLDWVTRAVGSHYLKRSTIASSTPTKKTNSGTSSSYRTSIPYAATTLPSSTRKPVSSDFYSEFEDSDNSDELDVTTAVDISEDVTKFMQDLGKNGEDLAVLRRIYDEVGRVKWVVEVQTAFGLQLPTAKCLVDMMMLAR